jgi:thioredoxin 1
MSKSIVYYSAIWCQPCKVFGPIVEKFASDNKINLVKLDIDKEPELAQDDNVTSVPTLVIYDGTTKITSIVGAKPRPYLDKMVLPLI